MYGTAYLLSLAEFHSVAWSFCKQNGVVVLTVFLYKGIISTLSSCIVWKLWYFDCIHVHLWFLLV